MPIGLATSFHRASSVPPDALLDAFLRAGAAGVLLDETLTSDYLAALRPRLAQRRGELPVWAVENVCPATPRAAAELAGLDREEAATAVAAATATMRLAADCGGEGVIVLLRLGEVAAVRADWPAARRAFLRDELAGSAQADALRQARDAHAPRHLDQLLRSLERLGRVAESCGVRLGLRNPGRYIGLPSPLDLRLVLAELAGAPMAPALDLPAAHLADVMGLRPFDETLAAWRQAEVVLAADACAQIGGLVPGRGEVDVGGALAGVATGARRCFVPRPDLDQFEVRAGIAALAALAVVPAAAPAAG